MNTKKIVISGLFVAGGLILPMIFHLLHLGGPIFLPMHIPVLLGGLLLGPLLGAVIGIITPILSSLMTGMPPLMPILPIMVSELSIYGLTAGYLHKKKNFPVTGALIVSMIAGRIMAGIIVFLLMNLFAMKELNPVLFVRGAIITGFPGVIIQIFLIPIVMKLIYHKINFREKFFRV